TIRGEDCQLERLPGPGVAREDDAVWRVEPANQRTAGLPEHTGELSVDPDLCVVVDDDLEDRGRPGRVESAHPFRDGHADAIPTETQLACGTSRIERRRVDRLPF